MSAAISRSHSTKRSINIYQTSALDMVLAQAIEAKKNEREKADIQVMNAFMEKAGLLSDDEFFGGL